LEFWAALFYYGPKLLCAFGPFKAHLAGAS
jgi:hypothetical protein